MAELRTWAEQKKWEYEQRRKWLKAVCKGCSSHREVADRIDIGPGHLSNMAQKLGVTVPVGRRSPRPTGPDPKLFAAYKRCADAGMSYKEAARELRKSPEAVRNFARRNGLEFRDGRTRLSNSNDASKLNHTTPQQASGAECKSVNRGYN